MVLNTEYNKKKHRETMYSWEPFDSEQKINNLNTQNTLVNQMSLLTRTIEVTRNIKQGNGRSSYYSLEKKHSEYWFRKGVFGAFRSLS